jgi:hypothetical protein
VRVLTAEKKLSAAQQMGSKRADCPFENEPGQFGKSFVTEGNGECDCGEWYEEAVSSAVEKIV